VQQLATRMEAGRQVALADVILVTKVDLADGASVAALERTLRSLNAFAPRFHVTRGEASPEVLDLLAGHTPVCDDMPLRRAAPRAGAMPSVSGVHTADVRTFAIAIAPRSRARLAQLLDAILRRHGTALLRMKGVVRVTDAAQLQVVQGVHDRVHPLEGLEGNADDAAVGMLVFIATVPDGAAAAALEAGVRDLIDAADVLRD
jgi:G3E family GTPase